MSRQILNKYVRRLHCEANQVCLCCKDNCYEFYCENPSCPIGCISLGADSQDEAMTIYANLNKNK